MSEPQGDGMSLRTHLESVYRQTGYRPEQLINTAFPQSLSHLWEYFLTLHQTRGGGIGVSGIAFTEILAWASLTGIDIHPGDVDVIKRLDAIFLEHHYKSQKAKK